jgi:hypothetical protein
MSSFSSGACRSRRTRALLSALASDLLKSVTFCAALSRCGAYRDRAARQSSGAHASMRCASDKSTEPMEIISIAALRGGAAGTTIIVATRR